MKKVVAVLLAVALAFCLCSCKAVERDACSVSGGVVYVLNRNTKRFHLVDCRYVPTIKESHKKITRESRTSLIADGYIPCKVCHP